MIFEHKEPDIDLLIKCLIENGCTITKAKDGEGGVYLRGKKLTDEELMDCILRPMECCANCRNQFKLTKFDYSKGGCEHTDMDGYICMAFASEEQAVWMVGCNEHLDLCECYIPKDGES